MQMGMKILKITKALYGDCSTSFGIVTGYGLSQIKVQYFPRATTQFCQKTAIKHEIDSQTLGMLDTHWRCGTYFSTSVHNHS